jgi:hypothetical protein
MCLMRQSCAGCAPLSHRQTVVLPFVSIFIHVTLVLFHGPMKSLIEDNLKYVHSVISGDQGYDTLVTKGSHHLKYETSYY